MSVYFALWAEQVWVVRRGPGAQPREWQIRMLDGPEHGVIEAGSDVRTGDEIYQNGVIRRKKTGRVVAEVDWERQAHLKRGVITWAGTARIRTNQKESELVLNIELHGMLLLDWLYSHGNPDIFYKTTDFLVDNNLSDDDGWLLVENLAKRGVIDHAATMDGTVNIRLNGQGIEYVQRVRVERADPVQRSRELRQRMLRWLYNQEHRGKPPADWVGFLASDDSLFYGDRFTVDELARQTEYLSAKDLIVSVRAWSVVNGMVNPSLTHAGQDCVIDFGGNVSDFVSRHSGGSTTNNVTMTNSTGNIVVASDNVQQNLETGVDTRKLLEFAGFVRQVAPTLGLPEDEQAKLDADATDLHQAAEGTAPDRNLLKRLFDAVMAGLIKAAPSIVTKTASDMGTEAIRAIAGH
jgi:hypothetical protein